MKYITRDKESDFYIELFLDSSNGCDNRDAISERFMIVLITKGTGMVTIDNRSIPYI